MTFSALVVCPISYQMSVKIEFDAVFAFLVPLILVDCDLEHIDSEAIVKTLRQFLEVVHGRGVLDDNHGFTYRGCLCLHLSPCLRFCVLGDKCKSGFLAVRLPIVVHRATFVVYVVKLLCSLVVFLAATFDRLEVYGCLCHCRMNFRAAVMGLRGAAPTLGEHTTTKSAAS